MSVESRLSQIRQSRGVAASDLAKRVGVSRQTVYAIEAGSYVPNTAVALKLARELEVSVEELFSLAETPEPPARNLTATMLSATASAGSPVRLSKVEGNWICAPATSAPYYLAEADGIVVTSGRRSKPVEIRVLGADESLPKRLVIAGCDPAIGLLAHMAERFAGIEVVTVPASSHRALEWLKEGKVHIAGSHLEDPVSKEFNLPFIRKLMPASDCLVVTFACWEEGFVVARGNPHRIRTVEDLTNPQVRLVNREPGSGSRVLLDALLRKASIAAAKIQGFQSVAAGHLAAAYSVQSGAADCCLATPSAARAFGLDFVPLHRERFDFAVKRDFADLPSVQGLIEVLQRASLRRKLEALAGYDTSETGRVVCS